MEKQVVPSLFLVLISAKSALACYPDPDFVYDDINSQTISIATALVTAVDLEDSQTSVCWRVSYTDAKYLHGNGATAFSVTTCADDVYQIEALSHEVEGFEYLGFVPGAEVLLGVIQRSEDALELRYAIPSCWGPLHVNLKQMTSEDRAEFVQSYKDEIQQIR